MIALLFTIRASGNRFGTASDAARHRQFMGCALELFRFALSTPKLPFHVLHVFGPGDVGKTSLLGEFAYRYEQVHPPTLLSRTAYRTFTRSFLEQLAVCVGTAFHIASCIFEDKNLYTLLWPPRGMLHAIASGRTFDCSAATPLHWAYSGA